MPTVGRRLALPVLAMVLVLALCASPAAAQTGRVSAPLFHARPVSAGGLRLRPQPRRDTCYVLCRGTECKLPPVAWLPNGMLAGGEVCGSVLKISIAPPPDVASKSARPHIWLPVRIWRSARVLYVLTGCHVAGH